VLAPAFKRAGASLHTVVSASGVTAAHHGAKHGFQRMSTDADAAICDPAVAAVVVATRHDSHARYVLDALNAGKHVFVEKPLCLTLDELASIAAHGAARSLLMVGFNRRFAPQVRRIRTLLATVPGPKAFAMTVNAGAIPAAHWTQDVESGGGRLLGEGCHFIDLLRHLAGESIVAHETMAMDSPSRDSAIVNLKFADGSVGTIQYLANGGKAFQKERLEVFAAGRSLRLDNFRRLTGFNWPGFSSMNLWRQDKGQRACVQSFVEAVRAGGPMPIALAEILEVARLSIEVQQALR
jgi:predicted dehydrogenase